MDTSKHDKSMVPISLCFGIRVESVSGNYHGCTVRIATSRQSNTTRVGIVKAKKVRKLSSDRLFDNRQDRGDFGGLCLSNLQYACMCGSYELP